MKKEEQLVRVMTVSAAAIEDVPFVVKDTYVLEWRNASATAL